MIVLDTSGVLAAIDGSQEHHEQSAAALRGSRPPYLVSPFVLAELDYLIQKFVGERERRAFLREVEVGSYQLVPFRAEDLNLALELIERYSGLALSLADASVVAIAERYATNTVLSLDARDFRAVQMPSGGSLRLFPADFISSE